MEDLYKRGGANTIPRLLRDLQLLVLYTPYALAARPLPFVLVALGGLPFAIFILPLLSMVANAELIDCYRWDGTVVANNTKCPGSNACCGPNAVCLSNRLCTPDRDPYPDARLVRGPCALKDWDDGCPQICTYQEGRLFPRVETCPDGSYCCDDDPECCEKGLGVFLNESGNTVATKATGPITRYPPRGSDGSRYTLVPTMSSGAESSATSSGATPSNSAPLETLTTPPDDTVNRDDTDRDNTAGRNNSLGLKIGLGFGIPCAVLITAVLMYFWIQLPAKRDAPPQQSAAAYSNSGDSTSLYPAIPQAMEERRPVAVDLMTPAQVRMPHIATELPTER
ncbi:hypothetical protein VTI28DRAFT_7818 [Corynascus sepedonium]